MSSGKSSTSCGIFAKAHEDADAFCHNLILSYTMAECVEKMETIQKEYNAALLKDDQDLIEQKKIELQTYQSSLTFTAFVLGEVDQILT